MSDKALIQDEFGRNAQSYVDSKPHRRGASLARLVELVPPAADWRVLDVAAAIGFTAYAFAPHVAHVWVTDITQEMLDLAHQEAADRGLTNVTFEYADAEALPYADAQFDLVTCRIAPHHFGDIDLFVREAARVLRPGGVLAVVDNIVPQGVAGDYVNAFEKLRDPSHARCLSLDEWLASFTSAGLTVKHSETLVKPMVFETWAKRHNADTQRYLRSLLSCAPQAAADFWRVFQGDEGTTFHLLEGIIIARKGRLVSAGEAGG